MPLAFLQFSLSTLSTLLLKAFSPSSALILQILDQILPTW